MRTRSEVSEEAILQSDGALIFVKLRKMIASETQSTDTILGTIAVAAQAMTGATGAAIAMPREGEVVCVGRSGETAPELGDRLNVNSGISGECLRTGVILRCDDADRDLHVDAKVCRQLGLRSIAVVPLRGQQGRVGVLEAFSTQSYAFTEDKMELLGRLAGLAEAAWARGTVAEIPAEEEGPALTEIAAEVEAPVEQPPPAVASAPPVQVREVLSTVPRTAPHAATEWRKPAIAAVGALALALLSIYGWRAWHGASPGSGAGQRTGTMTAPVENASGTGFTSGPDVVRPASAQPRAAAHVGKTAAGIPGEAIRRRRQAPHAPDRGEASGDAAARVEEIPQMAASSADPSDLGNVLAAAPALPKLGVPISQGTAGGVLVHKVQPVYPPEARRRRLEGSVVLDAVVNVQGQLDDLKLISGDPILSEAALEAVRKWRYSPYLLNGKAIPKPTRITISFVAPQ